MRLARRLRSTLTATAIAGGGARFQLCRSAQTVAAYSTGTISLSNRHPASAAAAGGAGAAGGVAAGKDHNVAKQIVKASFGLKKKHAGSSADVKAAPKPAPAAAGAGRPIGGTVLPPAAKAGPNDPELIFNTVWKNLIAKHGEERLVFPKEIMFLAGAPGAGKGVHTPFILQFRGLTAKPIEVSQLLKSPEAEAIKAAGHLVGDRQVFELLLDALLDPKYASGVIVDGFPRTAVQAECIDLLYKQMHALRHKFANTDLGLKFRRPIFHALVLFIDENESVRRQLLRGKEDVHHNAIVAQTGVGKKRNPRPTDTDPKLAQERYRQFRDQVYDSLQLLKQKFHFHFINAEGSIDDVKARVVHELTYQSALELGDSTLKAVSQIPLASEMTQHARQALVKRLDDYTARNPELLTRVVALIQSQFSGLIMQQALQGKAIIRSDSELLREPMALDILLDVLCERGYSVVLDYQKPKTVQSIDPKTGDFQLASDRLYEFHVTWPRPALRFA